MGSKEAQTQVEQDRSWGRLYRTMAPSLRHVLSPSSRTNGIQPENRVQQADHQNRPERQRSLTQGRIPPLWSDQDRLRNDTRHNSRTPEKTRRSPLPSPRTTRGRVTENAHAEPGLETGSIDNWTLLTP